MKRAAITGVVLLAFFLRTDALFSGGGGAYPSPAPRLISTFFFLDSQRGWAVAESSRPALLKTEDGGRSWSHLPTHVDKSFYCLRFFNAEVGYALTLESEKALDLYRTSDGGKSWNKVNSIARSEYLNIFDIYLPTTDEGWLVGDRTEGKGWIGRFSDSGRSLKVRWNLPADLSSQSNALTVFGDGQNNIWIAGKEMLLHSADSGANWENQYRNLNKPFDMANSGSTVGNGAAWLGTDSGFYQTRDNGTHWTRVADLRDAYSVAFTSLHEGCSVGITTGVMCTRDGGVTWREATGFNSDEHGYQLIPKIQMFPDQGGWSELNGVLYHSEDGGRTFFPVLAKNPVIGAEDVAALQVALNGPASLAYDPRTGFLYIGQGNRIARLDTTHGTIREFAHGSKEQNLDLAWAALVSKEGELWAGSFDGEILHFNESGSIFKTVEPTDEPNGLKSQIEGIASDGRGGLVFSKNHVIKRFDLKTKIFETIVDENAAFKFPMGIAISRGGDIFVADYENCRIRRIDRATRAISTIAGDGRCDSRGDGGPAISASLNYPSELVIDESGNLFFAEGATHRIRRIDTNGAITTYAGTGKVGFGGDGGPATKAQLNNPSGLALDPAGNLYISEYVNNRVRRVDARTGVITTVAGDGYPHRVDIMM